MVKKQMVHVQYNSLDKCAQGFNNKAKIPEVIINVKESKQQLVSELDDLMEITYELKGYIDYVYLELKGKAFDIEKVNKLQKYIINQKQS